MGEEDFFFFFFKIKKRTTVSLGEGIFLFVDLWEAQPCLWDLE